MRAISVKHAHVPRGYGTRDEVERWFGRIPVERLGLGEREIFYVPRLHLRLRGPPGTLDGRIPEILFEELRALLAAAGRGGQQRFAPDRAYVFDSRARYLAWLIRLWIGELSAVAREAFRGATGHPSLASWQRAAVLRQAPEFVATLARLAETGHAARWLERFDSADLAIARQTLQSGFGLALPEPPPGRPAHSVPAPSRAGDLPTDPPATLFREIVEALRAHGNDWHALPPPARALLLACALLARVPASSVRDAPMLATRIADFAMRREATAADMPPAALWTARERPVGLAGVAAHAIEAAERERAPPVLQTIEPLRRARPTGREPDTEVPMAEARAGHLANVARARSAAPGRRPPPRSLPPDEPFLAADAAFDSAFGGLLFLINAFVALGLYPDFTQPLGRRLDPSPLWLVDRIGRWWFGARYRRDPLADWIAANAARGRLPPVWRAKEEWLAGFGAAPAPRLFRRGARATLWHRAGFPLLDGPEHRLARYLRRPARGQAAAARRPHPRLPACTPDRWAACLALYLDARLRLFGAGLSLLELPANIRVRDLDLDAGFRLDIHPIALRMAGLDRNPGWQPAEGRSIAFGFE